jgi:O-antigen ligase
MALPRLRIALLAAGLLLTTNGPLLFVTGRVLDRPGFPPRWEDVAVRPVLLGFAALAVVLVIVDLRRDGPVASLRPDRVVVAAVVLFPVWALTSTVWSEQPGITFWRALVYAGLAVFAAAVAALDDRALTITLVAVTVPAVALSAVVALARPSVGIHEGDGFWQGIYTNPNSLGPVTALGILAGLGALSITSDHRARAGIGAFVALSAVVLYESTSRTSWFALAIALGAGAALWGARTLTDRLGPGPAAARAVPVTVLGAVAVVAALWSRWDDPTFAQRRTIWRGAWGYVDERWIQGYGFFSFFEVPGRALEHPYFDRGSAHSSPLEVLLGLGVIGLALFVVVAGAALLNAGRSAWREPSGVHVMWFALVVFLVVENLTESFVLWFSYNWVLLCAAALRRPPTDRPAVAEAPMAEAAGTR